VGSFFSLLSSLSSFLPDVDHADAGCAPRQSDLGLFPFSFFCRRSPLLAPTIGAVRIFPRSLEALFLTVGYSSSFSWQHLHPPQSPLFRPPFLACSRPPPENNGGGKMGRTPCFEAPLPLLFSARTWDDSFAGQERRATRFSVPRRHSLPESFLICSFHPKSTRVEPSLTPLEDDCVQLVIACCSSGDIFFLRRDLVGFFKFLHFLVFSFWPSPNLFWRGWPRRSPPGPSPLFPSTFNLKLFCLSIIIFRFL